MIRCDSMTIIISSRFCLFVFLVLNSFYAVSVNADDSEREIDLITPTMTEDAPAAGKRVRQIAPEYVGTKVYHALYLPSDWKPGGKYPVIVEYTGNKFPPGKGSGEVKDANLGYGMSGGKGFIWVTMPYVQKGRKENAVTWWGDKQATVDYCKVNLPRIYKQFGGDVDNVFVCGFSRGAIGSSYIGLADDDIANLWKGMFTHDHFDGHKKWGYENSDRASALTRLSRLKGRPVLICGQHASNVRNGYLEDHLDLAQFTFLDVPTTKIFNIPEGPYIHSHTDLWMHRESPYRRKARAWLKNVLAEDRSDPLALNFHLMHPGGDSKPGDPNAAFYLDGTFHLHYILSHDWTVQGKTRKGFSFVHVTSPDMLHWTWQTTKLQPSFTGHGMYSGTGFLTTEGKPAIIYHGAGSGRNQIAIAKDRKLSAWEKPFPVEPKTADGKIADIKHWDPDCFVIGGTYYAFSGGRNPPLLKSNDLKNWTYVGDFLKHEPDNVVIGEDISCGNFFPIGDKWMLLCISHPFGCRYYLGDWDAEAEQFVPETHGRMNWRSDDQDIHSPKEYRDFFAPESVLTADGRRVMWSWLTTIHNNALRSESVLSLPRELSLGEDGTLRIQPLREMNSQRQNLVTYKNIEIVPEVRTAGGEATKRITELRGSAHEIRITVDRKQAERKRFGFRLFADEDRTGLPIYFQPNNGTLRVGDTEAPFAVADLPDDEDVELRIFIDKYLVEVYVNGRQAMVAADMEWQAANGFDAYTWGAPTTIKTIEIWDLKPTNQGYVKARKNRIWEPTAQ